MSNYDDGETVEIIRIYANHCPPKLEVDHSKAKQKRQLSIIKYQ